MILESKIMDQKRKLRVNCDNLKSFNFEYFRDIIQLSTEIDLAIFDDNIESQKAIQIIATEQKHKINLLILMFNNIRYQYNESIFIPEFA